MYGQRVRQLLIVLLVLTHQHGWLGGWVANLLWATTAHLLGTTATHLLGATAATHEILLHGWGLVTATLAHLHGLVWGWAGTVGTSGGHVGGVVNNI